MWFPLELVEWLSGMPCRAAFGGRDLSGFEFRVGQVPIGRFGKLSVSGQYANNFKFMILFLCLVGRHQSITFGVVILWLSS